MPDRLLSSSSRAEPPPSPSAKTAGAVQQQLRTSAYVALRDVRCVADEGVVVLRGRVPSFHLKQLAQEVVRHTDGECRIVNDLEVAGNDAPVTLGPSCGKSKEV